MRLINGVRKSDWPAMATRAISRRVRRASRLEVSPGFRVIVHAPAARSVRPKQPALVLSAGNEEVRLGVRSSAFGILSGGEATKNEETVWSDLRWVAEEDGPGQNATQRARLDVNGMTCRSQWLDVAGLLQAGRSDRDEVLEQVPGDDDPLDLGRPLADLADLGVTHHPLHRIVLRVAVASEQLDAE